LSFLTLRDDTGDLQVALDKKRLDEKAWQINDLLDLGDQIVVEGALGTTKKGEVTVWATKLDISSKALLPPPSKYQGLEDVELRYRQRYVDLWANPEVMKLAKLRTQVVQEIRNYLIAQGYIEVETPMMQLLHGGAAAKPFVTHHNALDIPLYMRIAPELFLKRLLVGGMSKVFEINRNFRNEGISPRHNPEFTMLEAYEAYGSWETMADMVEGLICHVAEKVFGTLQLEHANGRKINLTRPWRRVRMVDLIEERTGWRFDKKLAPEEAIRNAVDQYRLRRLREAAKRAEEYSAGVVRRLLAAATLAEYQQHFIELQKLAKDEHVSLLAAARLLDPTNEAEARRLGRAIVAYVDLEDALEQVNGGAEQAGVVSKDFFYKIVRMSPAEQLVEMYERLIEPTLIDPTFVTHVPSVIIPLAKENREDPFFADVYELAINGVEISPGYTELNDPDVQARHFSHQVGDKEEQHKVDEDFLNALRYGMPPAGGMGMGVDRVLMMLTGAESIRDVILFPLMRPQ
jgi:lysyl-tRNA synthetase class 2